MTATLRQITIATVAVAAIGAIVLAPRAYRAWVDRKSISVATDAAAKEGTTIAAAVERYRSENGSDPTDLERDLVPKYAAAVFGNWYLIRDGAAPKLSLHSNLPEWLLQYDFASKTWTVELVGRTVDVTSDVSRARRSP